VSYDRTGTGRWVWIKTVGSSDDPLEREWLEGRGYLLDFVWFPKYPRSIRGRDLLVYYAATHGVFPAVVEVRSDEVEESRDHPRYSKRWPWRMAVRPRLVLPNLDDAPTLEQVGINSLRLRRQSHIVLTDEEWEQFRNTFLPPPDAGSAQAAA
jgi:hypothetical protein